MGTNPIVRPAARRPSDHACISDGVVITCTAVRVDVRSADAVGPGRCLADGARRHDGVGARQSEHVGGRCGDSVHHSDPSFGRPVDGSRGQREHRVAIDEGVSWSDRPSESVVGDGRHLGGTGLVEAGVGGDDPDRRVERPAGRPCSGIAQSLPRVTVGTSPAASCSLPRQPTRRIDRGAVRVDDGQGTDREAELMVIGELDPDRDRCSAHAALQPTRASTRAGAGRAPAGRRPWAE